MRLIIFTILFATSMLLQAQIGINTQSPQGAFHVDPKGDTSGTSNTSDDVIVKTDGKVGIGTIAPSAKLHIKTAGTTAAPVPGFRLEDGNQGAGRVLTVIDNTGLATWKEATPNDAVFYVKPTTGPNIPVTTSSNYYKTDAYITLPPGRWAVMVIMYLPVSGNSVIVPYSVSATFADASTVGNAGQVLANVISPDLENTKKITALGWTTGGAGTMSGSFIINNMSVASKTYYFMMGDINSYGNSNTGSLYQVGGRWGEDTIVAFRIPSN